MTEYKVKQLAPNHADHISHYKESYLEDMFENEIVIAQPKYDGERMLIHIDNGEVYCTSRRFSKKTDRYMENQDKLPILKEIFKNFKRGYTVIDCECYAKDWSTIVGILHSLPERAIELQKSTTAKFAVFDCLFFDGIDMREHSYDERLVFARTVVNAAQYEPLHLIEAINEEGQIDKLENYKILTNYNEAMKFMQQTIDNGFEGIVVKSLNRTYYEKAASLKCKKFETVDCVVCGYQEGNGKYTGSVGALEIGYYDPSSDKVIKISKVNCSTDEERERWNQNREAFLNSVIEVKCQEVTAKSLRHPVYIRKRDDKDYRTCTKDTIFKSEE